VYKRLCQNQSDGVHFECILLCHQDGPDPQEQILSLERGNAEHKSKMERAGQDIGVSACLGAWLAPDAVYNGSQNPFAGAGHIEYREAGDAER
jgi:hypothetical protein